MSVTVEFDTNNGGTVFVRESLSVASLGELRRAVEKVRREGREVRLNLGELTLTDRLSLQYLATLDKEGHTFIDCPSYIETWIRKISDPTRTAPQH